MQVKTRWSASRIFASRAEAVVGAGRISTYDTHQNAARRTSLRRANEDVAQQSHRLRGSGRFQVYSVYAAEKQKRAGPAKKETLACRLGTEDRHARIAVVLVGGKMNEFAYYSKWKPRTCSIYLQRNDAHSKWKDSGAITTVNLERGAFLIEHKPGRYHIIFRDIDRERYCGMDGTINGSLTILKGNGSV